MSPRLYRLRRSEFGTRLRQCIIAPTEADAHRLAIVKYGAPIVLELLSREPTTQDAA